MSLNYIPMRTPDIASIRKDSFVNIDDPIENRSLLDPDVDGNEESVNNDTEDQKLMDTDVHDYTGADIYRASLMSETHYMAPSDLYYGKSHDKTDLQADDTNPSLLGSETGNDEGSILDPDVEDDTSYIPRELFGAIRYDYPSKYDEYYNESAMKAATRNALPDEEFGLPRLRKYPLNDQKHVRFAIRMFGHCKDPKDREELARRIFAKVKEFDIDVKIGKGNPLYEYAPKSLQESIVSLSAEIETPGIDVGEKSKHLSDLELRQQNMGIVRNTANVINFKPNLAQAIGRIKEYEFLTYFHPEVKETSFQFRMLKCLGGLASCDEVWDIYGLRPALCTDFTRPLSIPKELTEEEFASVLMYYDPKANWYCTDVKPDADYVRFCLSLYSLMGMMLLNPEFSKDMLSDYWLGIMADWKQRVQLEYDILQEDESEEKNFIQYQRLYDLCWSFMSNPENDSAIASNIVNFAAAMVSQKLNVNLNEDNNSELLDKNKCNEYLINQLGLDALDKVYLLPSKSEYPIFDQDSIRMAMDMIKEIKDPTDRKEYVKNLNHKYKEFGCTFSISVDHPYAQYADQNIIDHMTRILSEGDTVVDDQGTSDAGPSSDEAPWYVRSDVNGNVGQNLLQNKELGPNDKKNVNLTIDATEPIIN